LGSDSKKFFRRTFGGTGVVNREDGARRVVDDFQQNRDMDLIQKDPQVAEARQTAEKRAKRPVQVAQS
jgi:hypothetical protein